MIGRYVRTLSYLRPGQTFGRVAHLLRGKSPVARGPAPSIRAPQGAWVAPIVKPATLLTPWRFRFLEREFDVGDAWDDPTWPRLWRYHLHYFDDLQSAADAARRQWHHAYVGRWIERNPGPDGTGWEPYPLSLRLVNWIKWLLAGHAPVAGMVASAADQARYLTRNTETYLRGNHVFENAKALLFAGSFFESAESARWLAQGAALLAEQLDEQVLDDGGHFELSPMYHAIVLDGVLDLLNLTRAYPQLGADPLVGLAERLRQLGAKMLRWLHVMRHPDGEIALFNDAAIGMAAPPDALFAYASRLGLAPPERASGALIRLPDSGYLRVQLGAAVAIVDAAPLGPDYLPAHGHADTLSFEMSLRGRRVIVDSGVSTYDAGPERDRQRGTGAHNTVSIDDLDSSEVWASFRVGRRARVLAVDARVAENEVAISAAHDGYRWLPGRPVHRRTWRFAGAGVEIDDRVDGRGAHRATARLHIHPRISVVRSSDTQFDLRDGEGETVACVHTDKDHETQLRPATYHPRFGVSEPGQVIETRWRGTLPVRFVTRMSW